jgi:hypothetical protein
MREASIAPGQSMRSASRPRRGDRLTIVELSLINSVTTYVNVTRSTSLPAAWSGSETFTEFELPQTLGSVEELIVRFQVVVATASVTLPPTPFWVSRTEEYIGNDLIATTYANENWNEGVGFLNPQRVDQLNEALNMTTAYANSSIATGTSFFYLPIVGTFSTMKPYVKGFQAKLKIRIYFPSSIIASGSGTISLTDAILIAKERVSREDALIAEAHARGVVDYNIIVRERQQENTTFTANVDSTTYLRGLKNDTAGLLLYVTDQSPTNANLSARTPVESVQLQDQIGNKITEVLRQDFNKPFLWGDNIDSAFTAAGSGSNHVSIIPFSTQFMKTADTGCDFGNYPLSTLERLIVRPDSSNTGAKTINVVSYSYGHVVVREGKHYIQMSSASSR